MTIRKAELSDMTNILRLIERFNDEYFGIPINTYKTIEMVSWIIEDGVGLLSERGFIGGVFVNDLIRDWTILQELGWYSEDKSGIKLLDAFIAAGKEAHVNEVRVCTLETSSPIAGRILQRKGFAPLETSYRLITGARECQLSLL
jgi:N-acetylglutamate synthase-like GNAT family acetyltransferase